MHLATLLATAGLLCGCATADEPAPAAGAEPSVARTDPINALVARLSETRGMWVNGLSPNLDLPATAPVEQLVARVFQLTGFDKGHVKDHRVIESRQVQIGDTYPESPYTAVLVETDLGRKIVLLQFSPATHEWWSRVYDA